MLKVFSAVLEKELLEAAGPHCSPFSDTTIVASIASGVEPLDYVRTQLPFSSAHGTGRSCVRVFAYGFGISVWWCLLGGIVVLLGIAQLFKRPCPNPEEEAFTLRF